MHLEIHPYEGALPLMFGMSELEVIEVLGPAKNCSTNRLGKRMLAYDDYKLGFDLKDRLVHIACLPSADTLIRGIDPFSESGFERLVELDGEPLEGLGFVVLLNLGIAFGGFHDGDESQKGLVIFERGAYDSVAEHLKPWRPDATL